MGLLVQFIVQLLIGGAFLWLSIRIVDGHNVKNTFAAAVGWSLVMAGAGFFPLFGLILGLVVFFMVCMRYYELGFFQTLGVIVVQIGLAFGIGLMLAALGFAGAAAAG